MFTFCPPKKISTAGPHQQPFYWLRWQEWRQSSISALSHCSVVLFFQSVARAAFPGHQQHHLWLVLFCNTFSFSCLTQLCRSPVLDAPFFFCPSALFSSQFPYILHTCFSPHPMHIHPTTVTLSVSAAGKKCQEQDSWSLHLKFPIQTLWISCGRWWWIWKRKSLTAFVTITLAAVIQILLFLFEQVPLLVPSLFHCLFFKHLLETNTDLRRLCLKTSLYHKQ